MCADCSRGNGLFCIFDFCEIWKMLIFGKIFNSVISVMVEICVISKNAQQVCADFYQEYGIFFGGGECGKW